MKTDSPDSALTRSFAALDELSQVLDQMGKQKHRGAERRAAGELLEVLRSEIVSLAERETALPAQSEATAVLDTVSDIWYKLDRNWCFTQISSAALAYFRTSREAILGVNVWDFIPSGKGTIFEEQFDRAFRENCPVRFETYSKFTGKWVEMFALPGPEGLTVYIRDLAFLKQLEQNLSSTSEHLSFILEHIAEGYISFDREGRFLEANPAAEKWVLRRPSGEVIGRKYNEIFPELTQSQFHENFEKILKTGQPAHYQVSGPEGQWYEISGYPRSQAIEFYVRDVTENRLAQDGLRSMARFPEENPSPVLRISREGILLYANPASQDMLEHCGCQVGGIVPEWIHKIAHQALTKKHRQEIEHNTSTEIYQLTFAPVLEYGYVNIYGSRITERKRLEESLRESEAQLREGYKKFQSVLNSITEAYFVLDREWRLVDYNYVAEREFLKRPKLSLLGKVFWDEFPSAVGNEYYRQYHRAFETGQPVHFEALSGLVPMWYEVHAYPHADRLEIYLHNINERKRLESELIYQRDLLDAIFQGDPTGIALIDGSDLTVRLTNPAYRSFTPNPDLDPTGKLLEDIWTAENGYNPVEMARRVLSTGKNEHIERYEQVRESGEPRSFSVMMQRLDFGEQHDVLIVTWEITGLEQARRQAEDALLKAEGAAARALERETELETVINAMTEAVMIFDLEGNIVRTNPAAMQYLEEDPTGLNVRDLMQGIPTGESGSLPIPFDDLPVNRALTGETVHDHQIRVRTKSGQQFEALSSASPLYLAGQLAGVVLVWHDVTERERLHQQVQIERALLEATIEQMPSGMILIDAETEDIVIVNQPMKDIWQLDEVPKDFVRMFRRGRGYNKNGKLLRVEEWPIFRAMRKGEVVQGEEIHIIRNDHTEGTISVSASPVYDANGHIVAGVSIAFDITNRIRGEQNNQFLARFGQRLMGIESPEEVKRYATRALGEYLGVSRCIVNELDWKNEQVVIESDFHPDRQSLSGIHPLPGFYQRISEIMTQEGKLAISNTALHPDTADLYESVFRPVGMRAYATVSRIKDGKWVASLSIANDRVREWQPEEIALLRSASDLVWLALEGGRLMQDLREVTSRFDVALKNAPVAVYTNDRDLKYTWIHNAGSSFLTEEMLGKRDDEVFPPDSVRELVLLKQQVLQSGSGAHNEMVLSLNGTDGVYDFTIEPLLDSNGAVSGLTVAMIDMTGLRRLEEEMEESAERIEIQRQILRHREMERQEIARDLHDGPLQEMIGLSFAMSEMVAIDEKEVRLGKIQEIQNSLQGQIRDVRSFCSELRPPALAPFGLEKAIRSHMESVLEKNPSLRAHMDLMKDGKTLPEEVRMVLYRAYQESLNNINRHAQASEVWITFYFDDSTASLEIEDNGKGFKLPSQWVSLAREGHLGLVGLHERIQAVNGSVEIDSAPGKGTRVRVTVPRS